MAEKSPGCTGQPGRRSAEVFLPEGDALHLKAAAPEVIQQVGVRGEVEGQAVGIQGLPGLAVAAVHLPVAVLAVPQQGATKSAMVALIWWVRPVSSSTSSRDSSPRVSSVR